MNNKKGSKTRWLGRAAAGLPGAPLEVHEALRRAGIDPDRLSIFHLGQPLAILRSPWPLWGSRLALSLLLWLGLLALPRLGVELPHWLDALASLLVGLLVLQAACEALVTSSEQLAARLGWNHYVAGTLAEILSTLPELVVIAFLIPISPLTAFVVALITIYNNTMVFSLYSFFLPKNREGKFVMPRPITEVGSQVLIAGAGFGLILGLVMLTLSVHNDTKQHFSPIDLTLVGGLLLLIFAVYVYKLVTAYAKEEDAVRETLALDETAMAERRRMAFELVQLKSLPHIGAIFLLGVLGAMIGGEQVSRFAEAAIGELGLNSLLTALILAGFAGMSEYVILWKAHRKKEYGIALANAFGGITQVMLLVVPFTLVGIGAYQAFGGGHGELPIGFDISTTLLLIFLFPTFFVLLELIEEDHTFGLLDTTIMTSIIFILILLLVTYGAA